MTFRRLLLTCLVLSAVAGWIALLVPGPRGCLLTLLEVWAVLATTFALAWLTRLAFRRFLWRVGRRLSFSYFLIGIVPIPLVLLLVAVGLYVLSGFFLAHQYRQAVYSVHRDLELAAGKELARVLFEAEDSTGGARSGTPRERRRLVDRPGPDGLPPRNGPRPDRPPGGLPPDEQPPGGRALESPDGIGIDPDEIPTGVRFAVYRDGQRISGEAPAPETWSDSRWPRPTRGGDALDVPFFETRPTTGPTTGPTLMASASWRDRSVVAYYAGGLERALSQRTGTWVELAGPEAFDDQGLTVRFGEREFPIEALEPRADATSIRRFFDVEDSSRWIDQPWVVWLEVSRPFLDPASGDSAGEAVAATLTATPRAVMDRLIPTSAEVGAFVYLIFALVGLLTFDIYLVALVMAMFMIFGLSRAVNRLTTATHRIQAGDFSSRIDVQRRDQVGALQSSFNEMASNLESLVADAAQKEILERELALARELQESLLPDELRAPDGLRLASHFRPSTAIGGDYYDLLPLADGRWAVAIADVSGHGLAAGLRMAMVKSALEVLAEEESAPLRILERLHHVLSHRLRSPDQRRAFVTASLAAIDLERGQLELTNAGHPPTYLLRAGETTVRELMLPSPPLGALGDAFARQVVPLEPGDILVWLSDGLIEAPDANGEMFGYERVTDVLEQALADPARGPERVKRALLQAVASHGAVGRLDDDLTLVVLGYRLEETSATGSNPAIGAAAPSTASSSPTSGS